MSIAALLLGYFAGFVFIVWLDTKVPRITDDSMAAIISLLEK